MSPGSALSSWRYAEEMSLLNIAQPIPFFLMSCTRLSTPGYLSVKLSPRKVSGLIWALTEVPSLGKLMSCMMRLSSVSLLSTAPSGE